MSNNTDHMTANYYEMHDAEYIERQEFLKELFAQEEAGAFRAEFEAEMLRLAKAHAANTPDPQP